MLKRYIGDKAFYRRVMVIALPIIMQNLITNLVSLLDNVMVGQLSNAQISAVTIVNNNLLFIFTLCLFGGAAGAGIFTTQFFGSQDFEGVRNTFRFKILICMGLAAAGSGVLLLFSDPLIGLYLKGDGDPALAADTLHYARQYMFIMLIGFPAFALSNAYASNLRECGHPSVPMVAGLIATGVNLSLNYVLIFGHLGAPALGVAGAAIATVIARYTECAIVVLWTHRNPGKNPYIKGLYKTFRIPKPLLRAIFTKGMVVLVNECVWSLGMAILNQSYSVCGLNVMPALSISTTLYNLTAVVFRSLGNTAGILTGQLLGAGTPEKEVRSHTDKLFALCVFSGVLFSLGTIAISGVFPLLYKTGEDIHTLATWLIVISSAAMPLQAYIFPVYFILRAGGKTGLTFAFDCGSVWLLSIPIAFLCSRFTSLPILVIFSLCQATDIIKTVIGHFLIKKGSWIQNLTLQ